MEWKMVQEHNQFDFDYDDADIEKFYKPKPVPQPNVLAGDKKKEQAYAPEVDSAEFYIPVLSISDKVACLLMTSYVKTANIDDLFFLEQMLFSMLNQKQPIKEPDPQIPVPKTQFLYEVPSSVYLVEGSGFLVHFPYKVFITDTAQPDVLNQHSRLINSFIYKNKQKLCLGINETFDNTIELMYLCNKFASFSMFNCKETFLRFLCLLSGSDMNDMKRNITSGSFKLISGMF